MVDPSRQQYNDDQSERIIRRALKMKNNNKTIRHQDLIEIANEIGIEPTLSLRRLKRKIREEKGNEF